VRGAPPRAAQRGARPCSPPALTAGRRAQNLCDPAHVPYAHHGIIGRREGAGPVTIAPTPLPDPLFPFAPSREGQSVDVTTSGARTSTYKVQFVPPGLVRYVMPKVRVQG